VWPRRRVRLDGIGAALEQQLDEFSLSPTTGPTERRALQQIVSHIGAGAGVE